MNSFWSAFLSSYLLELGQDTSNEQRDLNKTTAWKTVVGSLEEDATVGETISKIGVKESEKIYSISSPLSEEDEKIDLAA